MITFTSDQPAKDPCRTHLTYQNERRREDIHQQLAREVRKDRKGWRPCGHEGCDKFGFFRFAGHGWCLDHTAEGREKAGLA